MNKFLSLLTMAALCGFGSLRGNSLTPEESQDWKLVHSPEMVFQSEFTTEGLALSFQGVANSPNYISASTDVGWEAGTRGRVEVTLRAEQQRAIYFAVELVSSDGVTYKAIASGDPKRGYMVSQEASVAELPFSLFADQDGNRMMENTPIARVALIFAVEPEVSNTIVISKVGVVSNAN